LSLLEAIEIAEGKANLNDVLDRKKIAKDAADWALDEANIAMPREPVWDLSPERYVLSLDGENADEFSVHYPAINVLWASSTELYEKLTAYAKPSAGPWSDDHRSRSMVTAYRWSMGLAVTPPFVRPHQNREILIQGGNHRLRLAHHYGAAEIPILVESHEVLEVRRILPSAYR
jgi:hypothetical protein